MDAGFELQPRKNPAPADAGDRLLAPADAGIVHLQQLEPPAMQRREALVHAQQLGGEQRRLLATRSRTNLKNGVALVCLVLGQQHDLDFALERGNPFLEFVELLFGQAAHLGIGRRIVLHLRHITHFGAGLLEILDPLDDR